VRLQIKISRVKVIFMTCMCVMFLIGTSLAQNMDSGLISQSTMSQPCRSQEAVIILERKTDYFGVAPAYKLTINADGSVVFEGKNNVKTEGINRSSISKQDLQHLLKEFERNNYFSLRDKYESRNDGCPFILTDASYVHMSVQLGSRKKSILHYQGCVEETSNGFATFPQELFYLENLIDKTVNSRQWIK